MPEFTKGQQSKLTWAQLLDEVDEALALGHKVKPVSLESVTYLWLGKVKGEQFDRLGLLNDILSVYQQVLAELARRGIEWVQIDEPALVLELPQTWLEIFKPTYSAPAGQVKLLLITYFEGVTPNLDAITALPAQGLHVDFVHGRDGTAELHKRPPTDQLLSTGLVDGRNVWYADLNEKYVQIKDIVGRHNLRVTSSYSLLHSPVDLSVETRLDIEVKSWFALAPQKCGKLALLRDALNSGDTTAVVEWNASIQTRRRSTRVHNAAVEEHLAAITAQGSQRANAYPVRVETQHARFNLPAWPTTTIGSFPQTTEIRGLRLDFKKDNLGAGNYRTGIAKHTRQTIVGQERPGLDVLVHGEAERNDMIEYFSEHLDGFVFAQNGWVQSYDSRCIEPPVVIDDVSCPEAITVEWAKYAQSLTDKPVKGILTGPVTILCWLFPREDVTHEIIAKQIAPALRDEVVDLEAASIDIIQIDEPALREGLPLRRGDQAAYLEWGVEAFRINVAVVKDETQIHTHMRYCGFNDVMDSITVPDADVIIIETSRPDTELLESFEEFDYPNEIGSGVYDICSPNVPSMEWIEALLKKAELHTPAEHLWVNPDCGLKTHDWPEARTTLVNMAKVTQNLRQT